MSLSNKLVTEVEIKVSADKFFEMMKCKPYKLFEAAPQRTVRCELLEGEWGSLGSVFRWKYAVDENTTVVAKEKVEAINDEKKSVTFLKVGEEMFTEKYKYFKATIQSIPKGEGNSIIRWATEYEYLDEGTPDNFEHTKAQTGITFLVKGAEALLLKE